MSCNAHNHPPDCNCDFRGGYRGYTAHNNWHNPTNYYDQYLIDEYNQYYIYGDQIGKSFTTCVKCWYCKKYIFLYKSPFGSWVLFDELGPPWGKHICREYVRYREAKIEICNVGSTAKICTGWLAVQSISTKAEHIYAKAGNRNFVFYNSLREFRYFDKRSPFFIKPDNNSNTAEICGLQSALLGTNPKTVSLLARQAKILKQPSSDHEIFTHLKLIIERYENTNNYKRILRYNEKIINLLDALSSDCNAYQKSRIKDKFTKLFHQKMAILDRKY